MSGDAPRTIGGVWVLLRARRIEVLRLAVALGALACVAGCGSAAPVSGQEHASVSPALLAARERVLQALYRARPDAREQVRRAAGVAVFDVAGSDAPAMGVLTEAASGRVSAMTLERSRLAADRDAPSDAQVVILASPRAVERFRDGVDALPTDLSAESRRAMSIPNEDVVVYELASRGVIAHSNWGAVRYAPVRR